MSAVRGHMQPAMAVVKRDLLLSWSYRLQFVTGIFSGFVSLAVFYYISRLVRVEEFSPEAYFAFAAIGIVIFTVLTSTLQIPQTTLRQELVAGTFERFLLAPWSSAVTVAALLVFPALYALTSVIGLIGVGAAVFGLQLSWATVPLALPIAILSLLAFAPFGVLLLASVIRIKKAPPGANYMIAGLSLIGGLYFPIALLPGWLRWASEAQPLTPAVELLRSTLVGQSLADPAWLSLGKLFAFALVALPASIFVLRRAIDAGRLSGTILEY